MPKRLIVCCDGTWNTADQAIDGHSNPTNVTKLALSIAPEDAAGARQCVYYHDGVGTSRWQRLSGGAFGVGLSRNVFDAYHFLNHRWAFHDTKLSTRVNGAFHALAIDEQRAAFAPTLWHQQSGADGQELKQAWFTGVHCDMGGGYLKTSLSDIALLWMADRARDYGLHFRPGAFSPDGPGQMAPGESIDFKVDPHAVTSPHPSRTRFYRLLKPLNRPIGTAAGEHGHLDGCEYLAASAQENYDGDDRYRPPELVKYLANPTNVHLEPVPEKG